MGIRIAFINPVGTGLYDDQMERTLARFARRDTILDVLHFEGVPEDIAYYLPKHIIELGLLELAPVLERAGYDAIIVGCCFDPGVRVAREVVDIPVIGPLEAAVNMASYFGHDYSIVTDARKTATWIADLLRVYGNDRCRGIHTIDWHVPDMLADPAAVARASRVTFEQALESDGSEVIVIGCTTIAACIEEVIVDDLSYLEVPFINPSTAALQMAEALAWLSTRGRYGLSRRGFYQRHDSANPREAEEVRRRFHLADDSGAELALVGKAGVYVRRRRAERERDTAPVGA
jgi:Asp/Glu/hydantoin racemase